MQEVIDQVIQQTRDEMEHSIEHLKHELMKVRTGKAASNLVTDILVSYYGTPTPMSQIANIGTADSRTITIQPWEKSMIEPIERAIFEANLGLTPQNDGELVRLSIPVLTQDRRMEYVKKAKALGEDAKVSIRSVRHKAMDIIKKAVKDGYPEDAGKRMEGEVQDITNNFGKKVDDYVSAKEKDILTI